MKGVEEKLQEHKVHYQRHFDILQLQILHLSEDLEEKDIDVHALPEFQDNQEDTQTEALLSNDAFAKFQASLFQADADDKTLSDGATVHDDEDDKTDISLTEDAALQRNISTAQADDVVAKYFSYPDLQNDLYPKSFLRYIPSSVVKALYYAM